MANLARVRALWSGEDVVGPGVTTLYFEESGSGFVADTVAMFETLKALFPIGTVITVPNDGDLIDVATGELSGSWTDAAAGPVTAPGSGLYAKGVGARISWRTSGIRNGRRVKGSTFLVPMVGTNLGTDGQWLPGIATQLNTAANALVADTSQVLCIYSKPGGGLPGQSSPVTSALATTAITWLRTRRT